MIDPRVWVEMGLPWWFPIVGLGLMIALGLLVQLFPETCYEPVRMEGGNDGNGFDDRGVAPGWPIEGDALESPGVGEVELQREDGERLPHRHERIVQGVSAETFGAGSRSPVGNATGNGR